MSTTTLFTIVCAIKCISLYGEPTVSCRVDRVGRDAEDIRIVQRIEGDRLVYEDGLSRMCECAGTVVEPVRHESRRVDVIYANAVATLHVHTLPTKISDVDLKRK